jgi:hypothetical protein
MKIVFTRNNLPFSRFLRWGLKEPVSHMAIVFDDKLVFHSNFKGVHIEWFETFKKSNEIVFEICIDMNLDQEEKLYQRIITAYDGKSYDYMGLLYLVYKMVMNKGFKTPLPTDNKWASNNNYFCIELLSLFEQITIDTNLEVSSPYSVYKLLKEKYG